MDDLAAIRSDLLAEQRELDHVVATIDESQWSFATASPGWDVRDQIAHLTFFDGTAALAIEDADGFARGVSALVEAAGTVGIDEYTLGTLRHATPEEVLEAWRMNRGRLEHAAATLSDSDRVAWYGPSMGAKSFLTARLMECWAHGQDIVDALGVTREPTSRLRHIARLGYNTRGWSYAVRGMEIPDTPVRVELRAPDGGEWVFGPDDASDAVRGSAEGFCLVVTQRRHVDNTDVVATGAARQWMAIAQAFAGGPTDGPAAS